jgi:SAM-dependent methyltransferase
MMKDLWKSGDPYEFFMGRWSRLVAASFVEWLSVSPEKKWLDVGCGTGALSAAIKTQTPNSQFALDQSEGFIKTAQEQLGDSVDCQVGDALAIPFPDDTFDCVVSGLLLNFMPEPEKALQEMKRVTKPGGIVAYYVWDYAGKMEFLNYFWDTATTLNPEAAKLHESRRFFNSNEDGLKSLFKAAGLARPSIDIIEVETTFTSFEDFWKPFLGGQGPAPTYVNSISDKNRDRLRDSLQNLLPIEDDGSIHLISRAWAAKSII